ncbi:glycosyltransferase family 2 protein [Aeromonas schubertii]|uniref:glycosyltransferase family 2 protein n=1 Tax=Aeromonas schubertii TaxID=652 RepID=UPI0009E3068F|nr:glycosyltransferase [Aeromonas schubertii]
MLFPWLPPYLLGINGMDKENHCVCYYEPSALVSVLCISFNHEQYLRRTLDSIIMQDVDFKYEVLVHDDASQDNSQSIISEYEERYPELIVSLKRIENVYSKGDRLSIWRFFVEHAQGEFIAFCEGDDYWLSKDKLKKQIAGLISKRECNISFHPTTRLNTETGVCLGSYGYIAEFDSKEVSFISPELASVFFIENTVHVSSVVMRRCSFISFYQFFKKYPWIDASDYFIKLIGGASGALYIRDEMSVYRENVPGSWTSARENNFNLKVAHCIKMLSVSQGISSCFVTYNKNEIGRHHLLKYTLELHSLLHSAFAYSYLSEFYSIIKGAVSKAIMEFKSGNIIYFGAGTIFDALIGDETDIVNVIDKGAFLKLIKRHVLYSCELEEHSFNETDVIVVTPIFRGHSICDSLLNKRGVKCKIVIVDDLLTLDLVNKSIFSSAKRFLIEHGYPREDICLNINMK